MTAAGPACGMMIDSQGQHIITAALQGSTSFFSTDPFISDKAVRNKISMERFQASERLFHVPGNLSRYALDR